MNKVSIKRILLVMVLIGFSSVCFSQGYYFKEGREYESMGWESTAFSNYVKGMNAGDPYCAVEAIWCYLSESGTPMDIPAVKKILDTWATKDSMMCFYASFLYLGKRLTNEYLDRYYYDQVYQQMLTKNVNWDEYKGKNKFPPDLKKALTYAQKFNAKVKSTKSQHWLDYVQMICYENGGAGLEKNYLKALQIASKYPDDDSMFNADLLNKAFCDKSPFENFVSKINFEKKLIYQDQWSSVDKMFDFCEKYSHTYGYMDYYASILAEFDSTYPLWVSNNNGNEKKSYLEADSAKKFAIDLGFCMKCYNISNEGEYLYPKGDSWEQWSERVDETCNKLAELYQHCFSDDIKHAISVAYSRIKLRKYFASSDIIPWRNVEKVFDDTLFVECDGDTLYYGNSSGSNCFESMAHIISTRKIVVENNQKFKQMCHKNNLMKKIQNQQDDKYAKQILSDEEILNMLKSIKDEYPNTDILDNEINQYDERIRYKHLLEEEKNTYNHVLELEKMQKQTIDVYVNMLNFQLEEHRQFAQSRLNDYKNKRKVEEEEILRLSRFDTKLVKLHETFISTSKIANIKALNKELVGEVLSNVIVPSIEMCDNAFMIYPLNDYSSSVKTIFEEERIVARMLVDVELGKDIEELYSSYITQFPNGAYILLVNTEYAISKSVQLYMQPSQEEASRLLTMPITEDGMKIVKKNIKKAGLKAK